MYLKNDFLNFYFLNVENSLIIHDPELNLFICIKNIVIERTVSQNFDMCPSSFSVKFRKNIQRKITKSYPFLGIKKVIPKTKI